MERIIQKKQDKTYQTNGSPVDLLLYFDKDIGVHWPDWESGVDPADPIHVAIGRCLASGPFSRIWTYSTWSARVRCFTQAGEVELAP